MLHGVHWQSFHWIVLADPVTLSGLQNKSITTPDLLNGQDLHVAVSVPNSPEMNPNWFCGVLLARLGGTPDMLSKPGLHHPLCATNVLWATQLCTLPTVLGASDAVDHTWCSAAHTWRNRESISSVIAGVGVAVDWVAAHAAVRPLATLLEPSVHLSSSWSCRLWWYLCSHYHFSQWKSLAVGDSWGFGQVVLSCRVLVHQTLPSMVQDVDKIICMALLLCAACIMCVSYIAYIGLHDCRTSMNRMIYLSWIVSMMSYIA